MKYLSVPSQSQTHTVGFIEPNSEPSSFSSIKDEEDTDNDQDEDDDDDESSIGFSSDFLQRRRRRKKRVDPTAHIGADTDELYQDPADVARRNWGHETGGVDSADTMFSSVPPPVVVSEPAFNVTSIIFVGLQTPLQWIGAVVPTGFSKTKRRP